MFKYQKDKSRKRYKPTVPDVQVPERCHTRNVGLQYLMFKYEKGNTNVGLQYLMFKYQKDKSHKKCRPTVPNVQVPER
jgi:hypothetical protein